MLGVCIFRRLSVLICLSFSDLAPCRV
uniref:Uncharacterized protein n=1 Tax=Arundo donax TaxID=35708 RepID=A0A0A9HLM6_ARUDO